MIPSSCLHPLVNATPEEIDPCFQLDKRESLS